MANEFKPRNLRIYRHVTRTRILVIEDALDIGKLRIELTDYKKGQGVVTSLDHYLDIDTARLLFTDLRFSDENLVPFKEFKGSVRGDQVQSRIFKVEWESKANNPIKLAIAHGPGKLSNTGAIMPVGQPDHFVTTLLDVQTTRMIALVVIEHLQAWATATYYARLSDQTWSERDDGCSNGKFPEPQTSSNSNGDNGNARHPVRTRTDTKQAADKTSKARKAAAVTAFWEFAYKNGMEKRDVFDILHEHGDDDFVAALAALKAQVRKIAGA